MQVLTTCLHTAFLCSSPFPLLTAPISLNGTPAGTDTKSESKREMDLRGKFFFFLFFFLFFFVLLLLLLLLVFPPLFFNIYSNYRLFLRRKSSQNELFMTFTRVCLTFLQAQLFALSSAKLSTAIPCESPKNLWG